MSEDTMDRIERVEGLLKALSDERGRCRQVADTLATALEQAAAIIRAAEQQIAAQGQ